MRVTDLGNILENTGIPTAYGRFPEDQPQLPPYICYRVMRDNNFVADGTVFHKADIVQVELYTKHKDLETEEKVEQALSSDFVWSKEEEYIDSEKIYQIIYEIEV